MIMIFSNFFLNTSHLIHKTYYDLTQSHICCTTPLLTIPALFMVIYIVKSKYITGYGFVLPSKRQCSLVRVKVCYEKGRILDRSGICCFHLRRKASLSNRDDYCDSFKSNGLFAPLGNGMF